MSAKIQIADKMILVRFSYSPPHNEKVKQIKGSMWNADKKYWTIPYTKENIDKLFRILSGAYIRFGVDNMLKPEIASRVS